MTQDEAFRHEALDRTRLIIDLIYAALCEHPSFEGRRQPELEAAIDLLETLYQRLGAEE